MNFNTIEKGDIVKFAVFEDDFYSRFLGFANGYVDRDTPVYDTYADLKEATGFKTYAELEANGGFDAMFEENFDDATQRTRVWGAYLHKGEWVYGSGCDKLGKLTPTLTKDQDIALKDAMDNAMTSSGAIQELTNSGLNAVACATLNNFEEARRIIIEMEDKARELLNQTHPKGVLYNHRGLREFVNVWNSQVENVYQMYEGAKHYSLQEARLASIKADKEDKYDE